MSTRRFNWSFPSWLGLIIVGIALLVNWILHFFDGDLNGNEAGQLVLKVVGAILAIVRLIGFLFLFVYAYDYVASKPAKSRKTMWIFYWLCVLIVIFTQIWDFGINFR